METDTTQRRLSPAVGYVILVFVLVLIAATIRLLRMPIQLFILAALIALAISHPVNWLERHGVPRIAAIIAMLLLVVAAIATVVVIFLPRLVHETADLIDSFPGYWRDLQARLHEISARYPWIQEQIARADLGKESTKWVEGWFTTGWSFAVGVVGGIVMSVILLITVVFMLMNPKPLINGILGVVPDPWSDRAKVIARLLGDQIRAWLRGLVILGSIIGLLVGVGLWFLKVPYASLFGVLAGLLEMVPTVGPWLAALLPILVALAIQPIKALYVGLLFIGIMQLESAVLYPTVMKRQLRLHPVSTIFGFLAMGRLFGLFGAIIAVPTVACIKVLYDEIYYPWAHPGAKRASTTEPLSETQQPAKKRKHKRNREPHSDHPG